MSRFIDIHTHHPTGLNREPQSEGIHPWKADIANDISISESAEIVGEIGLDYACKVDKQTQQRVFISQLSIAQERKLPVVLHCVKAFEQTMKILKDFTLRVVIFHGFIGSKQQAQRALDKGYYLSYGDKCIKSLKTIEALRITPLDRIFAETDESHHKIEDIYHTIAHLRGIELEELINAIENNYNRIFTNNEQ